MKTGFFIIIYVKCHDEQGTWSCSKLLGIADLGKGDQLVMPALKF